MSANGSLPDRPVASSQPRASRLRASGLYGTIRPGLDPGDVLLMMGLLWRIDPQSDWRSRSGRLLDLLIDGRRAGAGHGRVSGGSGQFTFSGLAVIGPAASRVLPL